MNRYLIILIVLVVVIASSVLGAVFFLQSQPAAPNDSTQTPPINTVSGTVSVTVPPGRTKESVAATLRSNIAPEEPTTLYDSVIVGDYALQVWGNPVGGGEALLKYDAAQGQWILLSWGGGKWSAEGLVSNGVPQNIATALVANVPPTP